MSIFSIFYLASCVGIFSLGLIVFHRNPRGAINRIFFLLALVVTYSSYIQLEFTHAPGFYAALAMRRWVGPWTLAMPLILHLVLIQTGKRKRISLPFMALMYLPAVVFALYIGFRGSAANVPVRAGGYWAFAPTAGPMQPISVALSLWAFALSVLSLTFCIRHYLNVKKKTTRVRTMLVAAGIFCTVLVSILDHAVLTPMGIYTPDLAVLGFSAGCLFFGYAAWRYRLFGLNLATAAENIVSIIPDALVLLDRRRRILRTNTAARKMLGRDTAALTGKTIDIFFSGEALDDLKRSCETVSVASGAVTRESQLNGGAGQSIPVFLSLSGIRDEDGKHQGTIVVIRDMREQLRMEEERQQLEAQLRQSQKMEAIGQLAGGVAHDFNNLLGAILGYAELIEMESEGQNEKVMRYADTIISNSRRAADLTKSLLAFARKGMYEKKPLDLEEVVGRVISLLERTIDRRILITRQFSSLEGAVLGDENQLQHAILNLAVNARDAMPDGGEIGFSLETAGTGRPDVRPEDLGAGPGRYAMLKVSDTGTGISEDIREKIFEPFFTTKKVGKGTGLGLASVYGTVKNHNGAITFSSLPGQGTTFTVLLPLTDSAPDRKDASEVRIRRGSGRILVVDDEEQILSMAVDMLKHLGYDPVPFDDPRQAVDHFRRDPAGINLVLLDLVMPQINGRDCFYALQSIEPDVPVVLCSGFSIDGEASRLLADGAVNFIQKPFDRETLSSVLHAALKNN